MLPYFILGIALLAGLLLAGRWFASADTETILRVVKRVVLGLILFGVVFLAVTGRLGWALFALPALLPWFLRFRSLSRTAKNFSRMAGGRRAATGQTSQIRTRFLHLTLDHDSGDITGEVIDGAHAGRRLDDLGQDDLIDLLRTCLAEDAQSAQVLEAYLERVHPGWREKAAADGGASGGGAFGGGAMTREEAYQILDLESGASAEEIKEAHHRLMAGLHPDRGGSTYLATKLNQAKEVLLDG